MNTNVTGFDFSVPPRCRHLCVRSSQSIIGASCLSLETRIMEEEQFVKLKALDNGVYVLTFSGESEHRFSPKSIAAIHSALDQVEGDSSAASLITTNEGRFYSNGLDLKFATSKPGNFYLLVNDYHTLLERMLCFPLPTVAAICGHAAAGGCMLALAHDYRLMRNDKGFIFMNEVDIKLHLSPGMNAVVKCKMPISAYHKAVLSGYRFTGKAAEESGFIEASFPDVLSTQAAALKRAAALAQKKYDRLIYKALKLEMFKAEIRELHYGGHGPPAGVKLSKL